MREREREGERERKREREKGIGRGRGREEKQKQPQKEQGRGPGKRDWGRRAREEGKLGETRFGKHLLTHPFPIPSLPTVQDAIQTLFHTL